MSLSEQRESDMAYWGLDRRQRYHYLGRVSAYYGRLSRHHGEEAARYGRLASRLSLATVALLALVLVANLVAALV